MFIGILELQVLIANYCIIYLFANMNFEYSTEVCIINVACLFKGECAVSKEMVL